MPYMHGAGFLHISERSRELCYLLFHLLQSAHLNRSVGASVSAGGFHQPRPVGLACTLHTADWSPLCILRPRFGVCQRPRSTPATIDSFYILESSMIIPNRRCVSVPPGPTTGRLASSKPTTSRQSWQWSWPNLSPRPPVVVHPVVSDRYVSNLYECEV